MRVYYEVGFQSFGISRVAMQLGRYIPSSMTTAGDFESADMTVLHVVGRHDHNLKWARKIKDQGKQYAVIQYVLQSSRNPDPADWIDFWNEAKVVWSYYDLSKYVKNFYHAPLAADPDLFFKQPAEKKYLVGSNGNAYKAECIGEVHTAAKEAGGRVFHYGELFGNDAPHVDCFKNISDAELRLYFNQCQHFASLRRLDGFEMPAIEALLCGVRPIMFDTPNYRQWFDGLADFIPEEDYQVTTERLKKIFENGSAPVTDAEIAEVKKRFDWKRSITGFWERVYE